MVIKKFVVGPLENNCFLVIEEASKECFITDPGDEPDRIMDFINENTLKVKYLICTHAHFDHVGAVPELKKETGAKIVMSSSQPPRPNDGAAQLQIPGRNPEHHPRAIRLDGVDPAVG